MFGLPTGVGWVGPGGKARCDELAGGPSGHLQLLELETQRAVGVKGDGGIAVVDVSAAGARLISFQRGGRSLSSVGWPRLKSVNGGVCVASCRSVDGSLECRCEQGNLCMQELRWQPGAWWWRGTRPSWWQGQAV